VYNAKFDAKVELLEEKIDTIYKKVALLEEKIDTIYKKVALLEEKVDRNGKTIQDLDERVDTLGKEVIDYTKAHYSAHQKELDDHDSRIQVLEQFHV